MPLNLSHGTSEKRYGLFGLAILLFILGATAVFLGSSSFAPRSLGAVAIIASVYLVRISRAHARRGPTNRTDQGAKVSTSRRPRRTTWLAGVALLLLAVASFFTMYSDALHGGHNAWPAYLFAGAIIACAIVWGWLISRLL